MVTMVLLSIQILREIELHKSLRNPQVVAFHSYFEDDDSVYIILEMCRRKVSSVLEICHE